MSKTKDGDKRKQEIAVSNFKELWESLDMIYEYVATLNVGNLKGNEYFEPDPKVYAEEIITAIAKHSVNESDKRLIGRVDINMLADDYIEVICFARGSGKTMFTFKHVIRKLLLEISNRNEKIIQLRGEIKCSEDREDLIKTMTRAVKLWNQYKDRVEEKGKWYESIPEGIKLKEERDQALEEAGLAL